MTDLMTKAIIEMPYDMAMNDAVSRTQFHARARHVLAELEKLQNEATAWEVTTDNLKSEITALKAQAAKNAADAEARKEKYRPKCPTCRCWSIDSKGNCDYCGAPYSAAMKESQQ